VTDESDLLFWLIERDLFEQLHNSPVFGPVNMRRVAERVSEEVMRQLERRGAQVVRLHVNPAPEKGG